MLDVVGISFDEKRIYYFEPNGVDLKLNDAVIVETERGLQYGKVLLAKEAKKKECLNLPLKKIIRKATKKDYDKYISNQKEAAKAIKECEKLILKYKLDMKIISASFTFDRDQLLFQFLSDNRIDFRNLVKDLASIYKTRIELRQVGVRDKAKEIGGLGPCGRSLCCTDFLSNFDTVSINMAKNQNLSLNPTKINGACGRLLCCLNYENEIYEEYRKGLPNLGDKVKNNGKEGKVIELDILKRKYKFVTNDEEYVEVLLDEKVE